MITFSVTNTIQENNETIIVFVEYKDGNKIIEETARFPLETKVSDILISLKERVGHIQNRELAVIEMMRQLREDIVEIEA
jgi:KaiC/GvpD/RAD55 family RecA-like ATPase